MTVDELKTEPEAETRGSITLSVRLTDKQKELLSQAASLRGWTVANLLKTAALEKAAHIVNTSTTTTVDFKDVAGKVADQIFTRRSAHMCYEGAIVDADVLKTDAELMESGGSYVFPVQISPWHMPPSFAAQIEKAARFGGTEFLNLLVQACGEITVRVGGDLPDPIDPSTI
jgi:uncharacterized protein (DUF1778 family)